MSIFKIKLRNTDRLFSKYIRSRDGWKCLACRERSKDYREDGQGLHCSHYWGRGHENTRLDPDNCISLCAYHHRVWAEEERDQYKAFMIHKLGQRGYDLLEYRHNLYKKRDDKLDVIIIRQMLKEVQ